MQQAAESNILYLVPFPVTEISNPLTKISGTLYNIDALVKSTIELCDGAGSEARSSKASPYVVDQIDLIQQLMWIASEEIARTRENVDLGEHVVLCHVNRREA